MGRKMVENMRCIILEEYGAESTSQVEEEDEESVPPVEILCHFFLPINLVSNVILMRASARFY